MVKVADRTNEGAQEERARRVLNENVREINEAARKGMDKATAEGGEMLERGTHAAQTAANEFLQLWAELGGEQLRFNMETMRRLAQARSLPEVISIQGDYMVQTMSRLSQVMTRQLDTLGHLPSKTAR